MKKILLIILAAASVAIISCSKDNGAPDNPSTITLAKNWFVKVQGPTSSTNYTLFTTRTAYLVEVVDTFGTQRQRMLTDTITIDDYNLLSPSIKANLKIDVASRTFGAGQYKNYNSATSDSLILKEGKIFRNGGRSKSGTTVDSIYLKYAFKSAPSTDYILKGHERTGLLADEY